MTSPPVARTNEQETRAALAEVKKRKEGMERACGWFSGLKWRFLNTEVGVLVEVGKQVYAYKNRNRCSTPNSIFLLVLVKLIMGSGAAESRSFT